MHSRYSQIALSLVAAAGCMLSLSNVGYAGPDASHSSLLKGKVQRSDTPTRIKRPELPVLQAMEKSDASTRLRGHAATAAAQTELDEDDFVSNVRKMSPLVDSTVYGDGEKQQGEAKQDLLNGEVESADLVIAWEEWHRRVCAAIFQRWRQNGVFPGVARTTLRFTRDKHVQVIIREVELDPDVYELLPESRHLTPAELELAFIRSVHESVLPINGALLLEFPAKSRRKVVEFSPAFRGTHGPAGYNWKKDDYERVPVK